jgi:hypothetical protein
MQTCSDSPVPRPGATAVTNEDAPQAHRHNDLATK